MKIGIVGLPNVGKSTLFNALTGAGAHVANYPFCTIDSNVGVVPVPDTRLAALQHMYDAPKQIPATVTFVDIAGLVKGASHGEGMGNQFLSHIREVDAILHVVRVFEDPNVAHVGAIDPVADYETVEIELILADLKYLEGRRARVAKAAKDHAPEHLAELDVIDRLMAHLDAGRPARTFACDDEERVWVDGDVLLTRKPVMVVANVGEIDDDAVEASLSNLNRYFEDAPTTVLPVIAQVEAEINELPTDERQLFLEEMGLEESGLNRVIREAYRLLGLISFYTGNEKEAHAWTIRKGAHAPEAAGVIHSDFERGFIRAEVVALDDLLEIGSYAAAREKGMIRSEGKTYVVREGDYIIFRFNV